MRTFTLVVGAIALLMVFWTVGLAVNNAMDGQYYYMSLYIILAAINLFCFRLNMKMANDEL